MQSLLKAKERLEKEWNENCKKIARLDEKIYIMQRNAFEGRLTISLGLSVISWVVTMFLLPMIINSGIIPIHFIAPLSIAVPALIGIIGETLLFKGQGIKKRIAAFSKSISQKEIIEETVKYEIEREKLKSSNKVLKRVCTHLEAKQNVLNSISNEYNIMEKESDSIEKLKLNIEKYNEILAQKKRDIDTIATKKVLKERFGSIREKSQNIILSIFAGGGLMLAYDLPLVAINEFGNNIRLQSSILGMLAPFGIGVCVCGGYLFKRAKDYAYAFRNINKELEHEALSETTNDSERKMDNNNIECFDIALENAINDTCAVRIQLETEKQKLNHKIQSSETPDAMDDSMTKEDSSKLVREKKPLIKEELQFKKSFMESQVENDDKLLESPLIQKTRGPRLIKRKTQ